MKRFQSGIPAETCEVSADALQRLGITGEAEVKALLEGIQDEELRRNPQFLAKVRQFLKENGFLVPKAKSYTSFNDIDANEWKYPVMVKPVDSSGSKGITKVIDPNQLEEAFQYALGYSRLKIILIEEYIEKVGPQIGGDGFFGDSHLDFVCYGDQVVDEGINGYVPCGMKFPTRLDEKMQKRITR